MGNGGQKAGDVLAQHNVKVKSGTLICIASCVYGSEYRSLYESASVVYRSFSWLISFTSDSLGDVAGLQRDGRRWMLLPQEVLPDARVQQRRSQELDNPSLHARLWVTVQTCHSCDAKRVEG